jgi:glycine hydroxymethyltransferase
MFKPTTLRDFDPAIWKVLENEFQRQEDHVELIASENYVSPRVLQAQGSVLTNKYAEGYPHKRYYGGCEFVDIAEELAIERVKKLFGAAYANVQPHSGMSLADGGHLTHGSPVNFSGKFYHFVTYGVDRVTGLIDYDQIEKLAQEHKPKLIVAGFSAYSRIVEWQKLRTIADSVGAYLMADVAHVAGLIATGLYPSPINIADVTTTTTHKTLRGPRGGLIMAKANPDLEKKLNSAVFPGGQGGPLMHVIAAKAVAFEEALQSDFKTYQQQVLKNSRAMAAVIMKRGFKIVSGGTDNHLFLIDLIDKGITGKDADATLDRAYIAVNKNSVPNDPQSPFITSGLRLGTPAVTTRGFKETECEALANWICDILDDIHNEQVIAGVQEKVVDLCHKFPVYGKEKMAIV